jgi:hypothetical protein
MPSCASWDFESGTPEGWVVTNRWGGTNREIPSAFSGLLQTQPNHATSGNLALALGFEGDGVDYYALDLRIRLCPAAEPVQLHGQFLKFDVYAETGIGATPFDRYINSINFVTLYNDDGPEEEQPNRSFCDSGIFPDEPNKVSCMILDFDSLGVTKIGLLMRIDRAAWRGTIHLDNIRIEPTE